MTGDLAMMEQFFVAMRLHCPPDARILLNQFRGDPAGDQRGKWRARVLSDTDQLDPDANVYLCVSAMRRNERGEFRRRRENWAGGLLLMIDDLGTKCPLRLLTPAPPTALVETSPHNYQAIYMFDRLVTDQALFGQLIRAFIEANFLDGRDPGMAGVNRVFRPPVGVNGKPQHGGWRVRCARWAPERRYSVAQLVDTFHLELRPLHPPAPHGATADAAASIRAFIAVRAELRAAGMLKREEPDLAGWADVHCPWRVDHTGSADDGAAIRTPSEENGWVGAFKCHHGTCAGRGWRALTDWLAEEQGALLAAINHRAPAVWEGLAQ